MTFSGCVFKRLILAQHLPKNNFPIFISTLETSIMTVCAHSERYKKLMEGIFEILFFFGNVAFA